jgi:hypothetical protein
LIMNPVSRWSHILALGGVITASWASSG